MTISWDPRVNAAQQSHRSIQAVARLLRDDPPYSCLSLEGVSP